MLNLLITVFVFPTWLSDALAFSTGSFGTANEICFERYKDRWQESGTALMGSKHRDATPWDREYTYNDASANWPPGWNLDTN